MKKLLIALLASLSISSAFADTIEHCTNLSKFAFSVATARDSGTDRRHLSEQVFALIDEGKIRQFTNTDKVELGRIIAILYNHPQATPQYASQSYFQHCMITNTDI